MHKLIFASLASLALVAFVARADSTCPPTQPDLTKTKGQSGELTILPDGGCAINGCADMRDSAGNVLYRVCLDGAKEVTDGVNFNRCDGLVNTYLVNKINQQERP